MKHTRLTQLLTLLVAGLLATSVFAQPAEGLGRGLGRQGQGRGPKDPAKRLEAIKARLAEAVNPTEQQQQQIDQILDTHAQAVKNWHGENRDKVRAAREKFRQARKDGNQEAIKAAREELKSALKGRRELMENLKKQLGEVLSKEQMEKARQALQPRFGQRGRDGKRFGTGPSQGKYMHQLNLTSEQHEQIRNIMKEARKKVHDKVFTDTQRAKVKELRRKHHPLAGIATDEQIAKADDILKAARKKAIDAKTPDEKLKILKAAREKINNEVLSEEQRDKLKDRRKQKRTKMHGLFMKKLGLSDEQQAKARNIMEKAHDKAHDAKTLADRREILKAAREKVRDEIMTDQQREKLKELWKSRRGRRGQGQGRHGPGWR